MALDFQGNLWGVAMSGCPDGNGCAFRFKVDRSNAQMIQMTELSEVITMGKGVYSYSDMTGYQLRTVIY